LKLHKFLAGFLSSCLAAASLASPAFAKPDNKHEHEKHLDWAAINLDVLTENLKKRGLIDKNDSPAEMREAVEEFVKSREIPHGVDETSSFGKKAAKNQFNAVQKAVQKANRSKGKQREASSQEVHKDNIVLALIDFPNQKHNRLKKGRDLWVKDFNQQHYDRLMFNPDGYRTSEGVDMTTVAKYYYEQSGGTWTVDGVVTNWIEAEKEYEYYGGNDENGNDSAPRDLVMETLENVGRYIKGKEKQYDQRDPYDIDGDGNIMEPDGLLDNLMLVHAGVGEETGQDDNAIWSHRWTLKTPTEIPGTKLKAYDYMIQPENGAPGVFAHEYGHNLGLPDLYNTSPTDVYDSPVGVWSIMSSGSHTGKVFQTQPVGFDPWCKMVLQELYGGKWIRPTVIDSEDMDKQKFKLNEAINMNPYGKVVKIDLPKVEKEPPTQPKDGNYAYFSDEGDDLNTKMTSRLIDLSAASEVTLSFDNRRQIETGYDALYVNVIDTETNEKKQIKMWDDETEGWQREELDISEFAGKKIKIEFNYVTDGGLALQGFYIDNIVVSADGQMVFEDDAEGELKFELDGFIHFDGKGKLYENYYLIELRSHNGVDEGLKYFRRWDDYVTYDPGVVIWYYDGRYGKTSDNYTDKHPGYGFIGVVDAHQRVHYWNNDDSDKRNAAEARYQLNDAAFGLTKTSPLNIEYIFGTLNYPSLKGVSTFDDSKDYSHPELPEIGKILPELGIKMKVKSISKEATNAYIELSKEN